MRDFMVFSRRDMQQQRRWGTAFLFSYVSPKRQIRMIWGTQGESHAEPLPHLDLQKSKRYPVFSGSVPESVRWFPIFLGIWLLVFFLFLGVAAYLVG
jgi:hypothetical protein